MWSNFIKNCERYHKESQSLLKCRAASRYHKVKQEPLWIGTGDLLGNRHYKVGHYKLLAMIIYHEVILRQTDLNLATFCKRDI